MNSHRHAMREKGNTSISESLKLDLRSERKKQTRNNNVRWTVSGMTGGKRIWILWKGEQDQM